MVVGWPPCPAGTGIEVLQSFGCFVVVWPPYPAGTGTEVVVPFGGIELLSAPVGT